MGRAVKAAVRGWKNWEFSFGTGPRVLYATGSMLDLPSRMRRGRVAGTLLVVLALGCSGGPRVENVVLVTVDTLRADAIRPYGGGLRTPGFDALASKGVVVEGACTPTPSTGPAHASLFSGLHPWNHGVLLNGTPMGDDLPSLAVIAQQAGLATAAFVSSYIVDARWGFSRGFDHYHFEPSKKWRYHGEMIGFWDLGEETTDAALAWLRENHEEPFLVWIHYFDTHSPYGAPKPYRNPKRLRIDLTGKSLPHKVRSLEHLEGLIRAYYGEVAYVDAQISRLLDGLRGLGLLRKTALIVTADHGEGLGDHGWLGHGRNLHDELVVVPLLVRAPGIPPGRRLRGPAQLEDLMPTVLSLLGLPVPDGLDGVDLLPWLRGEVDESPRSAVVGRRAGYQKLPALFFQRRWPDKWIGEIGGDGQAYRLDADPRESSAVALPAPSILLDRIARARGTEREQTLDEEARQALEALGYLDSEGGGIAPQP